MTATLRVVAACAVLLAIVEAAAAASQAVASGGSRGAPRPDRWTPLAFAGIPATRYATVRDAGTDVVRAEADASASGLALRFEPPLAPAQRLRWRWQGERLPEGGDTRRRESDDAVARVYLMFEWPAEQLTAAQRIRDGALRALHGATPPHATLLYVWDASAPTGSTFANPYTDRVRNIVVESGERRLGEWLAYERDVAADFRRAFGHEPPPIRGIAVMTDADNTASRAVARYGDVTLEPR